MNINSLVLSYRRVCKQMRKAEKYYKRTDSKYFLSSYFFFFYSLSYLQSLKTTFLCLLWRFVRTTSVCRAGCRGPLRGGWGRGGVPDPWTRVSVFLVSFFLSSFLRSSLLLVPGRKREKKHNFKKLQTTRS